MDERPTWEFRDENQALMGRVWWDGKNIKASDKKLIAMLKDIHHSNKDFSDGLEFLKVIPAYFRSGYVTMNKVK